MNMPAIRPSAPKKKHAGHTKVTTANTPTARFLALIRSSAFGVGCSLGVALLLLLLSTLLMVRMKDPTAWAYPASLTILYLTALLCGSVTKRQTKELSWMCGLTAGTLLMLCCLLAGCFLPSDEAVPHSVQLLTKIPLPLISFLGASLASTKKRKPRRRKR